MAEKPLILLTHSLPADWIGDRLMDCLILIGRDDSRGIDADLLTDLPQIEGILSLLDDPLPAEILHQAVKLRVISNLAVGVDNIDVPYCTRRGIAVGHTPGVLTDGTADLTLALILGVCRMIPQASRDAREGRWSSWDPTGWLGVDLKGATVGIVGMGKIGRAVAARLKAFGTRLVFCNRSLLPGQELALGATQINLDELLQISDIVCLHVPLTPDTTNLIDSASFKIMKPGAVLINAARGAVVNTGDLQKALETGQIRAAGLDVTEPEPLPADHPLYQLENCLITPHIGSATLNTRQTMTRIAIDNLRAGLEGNQLPFCVNPEVFS